MASMEDFLKEINHEFSTSISFFPQNFVLKKGCGVYASAAYTWENTVVFLFLELPNPRTFKEINLAFTCSLVLMLIAETVFKLQLEPQACKESH